MPSAPGLPGMPLGTFEDEAGSEVFHVIDRTREAVIGQFTGGISPAALMLALFDWSIHLASAPGKQMEIAEKARSNVVSLLSYLAAVATKPDMPLCIEPLPGDYRFASDGWRTLPFSFWAQAFLLNQQWWHNVTHRVPGVTPHHEEVVSFAARQFLDVFSPSNLPFTNPDVIAKTVRTGGMNFAEGIRNWMEDISRVATGRSPVGTENFVVGKNLAVTPGRVVYRNHLIELIQYAPQTETVVAEPLLIVPAWIMRYYILDLSPENSLIRYLVGKGYTVFCISWRNPTAADRDLTMDDYRRLGVMAALDAVNAIVPGRRIHAAGYCLGGTLLSIAAAAMAHNRDDRLATLTLLGAQTDFSEPGELALFVDDSQVHFLESMMWNRGYLSADQMAGAFQLLRTNDLIWSRVVRDHMMGERMPMNDLMAWNADSTRMPYRMHAEYLQRLYLRNELASGRFVVEGHTAAIENIRVPMFVVGTERDHVAPWPSVYKIHYLSDAEVTFVLTSGGHNAGIVSEPGHPHRRYRVAVKGTDDPCLNPDEWVEKTQAKQGSWWGEWTDWLAARSAAQLVAAPSMGVSVDGYRAQEDAPGTYVFQK
ncbi:alpha/beta fold hydrolase [Ensifer sp. MPMI2T]|nr:alpha/beta fold hydrolase [Ensifer sp. MPMI2T]